MTETLVAPQPAGVVDSRSEQARALIGVLLVAFASLLLELALTRLFSVILFYHFAFLAISIALLGLGAGGVFAYIWKDWLARWSPRLLGTAVGLINAVLLVGVLEADLHLPVSLEITGATALRLTGIYLISALPFFFSGLFFSVIFARQTHHVTQLYACDLAGAALACLAVVPLLDLVGGPSTVILAAAAMAAAAATWAETPRIRAVAVALGLALAGLACVNHSGRLIDIVYAKGRRHDPHRVQFARWNAISRVEVEDKDGAKRIVIDADASTYIMHDDPGAPRPATREDLTSGSSSAANVLRPRGTYAIIGPGGGVDVLSALVWGSPSVTAIEINPIIVNDIMGDRFADYSRQLYQRPDVHVHVNDGRSWIRASRERFDVLQMTLVDTWASTAAGAFALSENNLYTVEAFREYFDHLAADGFLAITRWEFRQPREALRVASVAMEALRRVGAAGDLSTHFLVVSEGPLNTNGRAVTVLAKKSAFTTDEEATIRAHVDQHPGLVLLYSPSQPATGAVLPAGGEPFASLIRSDDPVAFARGYAFNVAPVTDAAPFFFFTLKPEQVWTSRRDHGIDWKVNMGVLVLVVVLAVSALSVLAFLVLPLALEGRARGAGATQLVYFVALGLGYILVEIAFIQRFVLFLGHPVYALTVVIFLMLLSSGAGSYVSRRWLVDPAQVWIPLVAIVTMIGGYVWVVPLLLRSLIGLPFGPKLLLSAGLLIPLGFLMGMPFPTGLRALAAKVHKAGDNSVEWAWAMNAGSGVFGSVLAMIIAIQFGLTATLMSGAGAYLIAAAFTSRVAGSRLSPTPSMASTSAT